MAKKKIILIVSLLVFLSEKDFAQDIKSKFQISGTAGVSYEYYGLSRKPTGWTGFTPRKPWNQVRFNFTPEMKFGKNFSLPFNFNFAMKPTNFAGPYAGIKKQSFGQFITNPMIKHR